MPIYQSHLVNVQVHTAWNTLGPYLGRHSEVSKFTYLNGSLK